MEYREFGGVYYIRMDRGDEIISGLKRVFSENSMDSAVFTGIGGLKEAVLMTFVPEEGRFEDEHFEGMLELVSMNGNIIKDEEGGIFHHTHSVISYVSNGQHRVAAGHTGSLTVLYTAEIEMRPVRGGKIVRKPDPETGTGFWSFSDKQNQKSLK